MVWEIIWKIVNPKLEIRQARSVEQEYFSLQILPLKEELVRSEILESSDYGRIAK